MRYLLLSIIILAIIFLGVTTKMNNRNFEIPAFLKNDTLAINHNTNLKIKILSSIKPTNTPFINLEKDYKALWAHLNNLYATNNVESGKEYYTEDWFKQICSNYKGLIKPYIFRKDISHELNIINWSSDELVCNAIDSNVILQYTFANNTEKTTISNIAIVLLFQGDHWRIDALKILNETPYTIKNT